MAMRIRMGYDRFVPSLIMLLAITSLIGCKHTPTAANYSQGLDEPLVIDMSTSLTLPEILARLHDTRVIYVGEQHDRFDHHQVQRAALEAAYAANPQVAVGVEWIQRPFQKHLDDYIAGSISEAEMLARTEYFNRWRMDYRLYRPILAFAREKGIPVIALNASRELTGAIREHGMDDLPADIRDQLPREIDRSDKEYEQRLQDFFKDHPATSRNFDRFLDVQLTWDETMAETAADYLQENPRRSMVILAGNGHLAYGSGIPNRLQRRLPVTSAILLNAAGRDIDRNAADYLVFTREVKLPQQGLIGAFLEDSNQGLIISGFSADSAVKDAGLAEQDVIVALNGQPVNGYTDLKVLLIDTTVGDKVTVTYRRTDSSETELTDTVEIELRGRKLQMHP